jgi:hypothetical protein
MESIKHILIPNSFKIAIETNWIAYGFKLFEIWGPCGSDYRHYHLLGCDATYSDIYNLFKYLPDFIANYTRR